MTEVIAEAQKSKTPIQMSLTTKSETSPTTMSSCIEGTEAGDSNSGRFAVQTILPIRIQLE